MKGMGFNQEEAGFQIFVIFNCQIFLNRFINATHCELSKLILKLMIKAGSQGQQIQYTTFKDLSQPLEQSIKLKNIIDGFQSKQWRMNFETLTHLRQANKFHPNLFIQEIFPLISQKIIEQIDNLRSNNSKQALTLSSQIIEHQNLQKLDKAVLCPLVSALFNKTTSQKAFLKKQALGAVQKLAKKSNPFLLQQIANQILSLNSQISELAAKTLSEYVENNKITEVNGQFLSLLIRTINGKRSVLQKKGREILLGLKMRLGQQKLNEMVELAKNEKSISEQEYRALIEQVKKQEKQNKNQQSLKDYLKMKKKAESI